MRHDLDFLIALAAGKADSPRQIKSVVVQFLVVRLGFSN